MKIKELLPGDKVDINIIQVMMTKPEWEREEGNFFSTVFDVNDDDTVDINVPIVKEKYKLLPKNVRYELLFTTSSGMYKADATITEHLKREGFYLLRFKLTTSLKKQQRREYYRIDCNINAMFMGLIEEAAMKPDIQQCKEVMHHADMLKVRGIGVLLDISGGGTRFVTSNSLKNISFLLIRFKIESENVNEEIEIVGKIISSERSKTRDRYIHRVQFFHKSEKERERLISYIFEEERRIRKKEQGL
ncbi:MAG: flagellar brake domain-containing protein [Lachnospiraceae bacterium]|nr:flagellar brake domain-containing protein [Lachnospiraceae bacterium]